MPVPKRKTSRSRRDKRQANKGITPQIVGACNNCNDPILPHQVCLSCGYYKGRKVLATKIDRTVKRTEVRAQAQAKTTQAQEQA